jgi:hypothetical protein
MGPIFERELAQLRKRVLSSEEVRESRSDAATGATGSFDVIDVGLHPYAAPGYSADHAPGDRALGAI